MFKSKIRPITIPQSEHARLAGMLAYHWGNNEIAPPPLPPVSFVAGVTIHDRGYHMLDTMAIGDVDQATWLATQRRGLQLIDADPVADTVALLHIQRLLARSGNPEAAPLITLAEERISHNIGQTPYNRRHFERADTITNLCDMISFTFCFEAPTRFSESIVSGDNMQEIQVAIEEDGIIRLEPWPLAVPEMRGFILGYELAGYPDHLRPVMVTYTIVPDA